MDHTDSVNSVQQKLIQLGKQQKAIEDEIITLSECLNAKGMPGLKGKLTDNEGFPRDDIDIPQIMSMRGRVACLQNDLTAVMKQIEQGLHELHQMYSEKGIVDESKPKPKAKQVIEEETKQHIVIAPAPEEAFLWISDVLNGSPAQ